MYFIFAAIPKEIFTDQTSDSRVYNSLWSFELGYCDSACYCVVEPYISQRWGPKTDIKELRGSKIFFFRNLKYR